MPFRCTAMYYTRPDPPPTFYSTLFNATENPLSESGNWLNGKTYGINNQDIQTSSGNACATAINNPAGPFDDSIAILNPAKFAIGANQLVTVTVARTGGYTPTNNHEINGFLRGTIIPGVGIKGYEINLSLKGDYGFIVRWEGTTNTLLSSFTSLTSISHPVLNDGDVIEYSVTGTTILVRHNPGTGFVTLGSTTDSTWATGTPGIDFWAESGSTLASAGVKDFAAVTL